MHVHSSLTPYTFICKRLWLHYQSTCQ